jgi:hypothetical protein
MIAKENAMIELTEPQRQAILNGEAVRVAAPESFWPRTRSCKTSMERTKVTDAGVAELRKALPKLVVSHRLTE